MIVYIITIVAAFQTYNIIPEIIQKYWDNFETI